MNKLFLAFIFFLLPFYTYAQQGQNLSEEGAIEVVRAHFFNKNYTPGLDSGENFLKQFPESTELHAWYIANLALSEKEEKAIKLAEDLYQKYPKDSWALFALVRALSAHDDRGGEAMDLMDKMVSMNPNNEYFHWLKAATISNQEGTETSVAYLDKVIDEFPDSKALRSLWAGGLLASNYRAQDDNQKALFKKGLEILEELRNQDPEWIDAYYRPAFYLQFSGDSEQAYELIKKATELTSSYSIHSLYWRLLMQNDDLSRDEKKEIFEADLESITDEVSISVEMLYGIANKYGQFGDEEKQYEYEEKILQEYPDDVYAEWVYVSRYRAFLSEHREEIFEEKKAELIEEYQQLLWDFINKPNHIRKSLLGDAYRQLFFQLRSSEEVNPEIFLEVVNGMVEYEGINVHITHGYGPVALAEKTNYYERAKEIAREGVVLAEEKINGQNERGVYETEEEYLKGMGRYKGNIYSALGWVFFNEGKLDSAQKHLSMAYSLHSEDVNILYRLGQIYEKKEELSKAENHYQAGVKISGTGENPNEEALKNLYLKMNGDVERFEDYLAAVKKVGEGNRKEELLSEIIENPELLPEFKLNDLANAEFNSNKLTGKITVINFWGLWCGPCVKEMPDIQKLHEKFESNPNVEVITINNDPDIDKVREWMIENEYTFKVLRDNGYLSKQEVYVFPTTWFTNKNSEISFVHEGYTENLVEEFSWRINYLSPKD
ncbi:MAG: redoxin domain-containing protein [Gracilimonas sp.]|uniref:redoxin domain-containing protein n=1 Tax=Gracilimonas sp. TaxID=1974203 RepID=UPI0019CC51E7|nr:redoxin domain-containing protein [Gracilimonas sp.]MBD3616495.1 redoxin domain-containing protein [Gracilimonas sp.]